MFCGHLRGWPLGNEVAFPLSQFGAFCDPEILCRRSFLKKRGLVLTPSACPFSKLLLTLSPPLLNIGCSQHASSSWLLVVIPSLLDELHFNQLHLIMISEGPVFIRSHYWQVRYAQSISPSPHARTISIWSVQLFVLPDPAGRSPVFGGTAPAPSLWGSLLVLYTGCSQHASSSLQLVVTPLLCNGLHFNQLRLA